MKEYYLLYTDYIDVNSRRCVGYINIDYTCDSAEFGACRDVQRAVDYIDIENSTGEITHRRFVFTLKRCTLVKERMHIYDAKALPEYKFTPDNKNYVVEREFKLSDMLDIDVLSHKQFLTITKSIKMMVRSNKTQSTLQSLKNLILDDFYTSERKFARESVGCVFDGYWERVTQRQKDLFFLLLAEDITFRSKTLDWFISDYIEPYGHFIVAKLLKWLHGELFDLNINEHYVLHIHNSQI